MGVQAGAIDAGTASTTITGLGGRPGVILFCGTNQQVYEAPWAATQGGGFFGFAAEDANGTIHNYCEFAILTTGRCSNLTQTCARAMTSAGGVTDLSKRLYEATVTDITDDSFTIDFSAVAPGYQIHYLAIWDVQPGYVYPYEKNCDGEPYNLDVGFAPSVWFAVGQWRNTCHTFPKSTGASLWNAWGMGDVSGLRSVSSSSAQSVISGMFTSAASEGFDIIFGVADPFVIGSICTGVLTYSVSAPTEVVLEIESFGCGGGYDFAFAQFSECLIGDVAGPTLGAGAIDSETAITLSAIEEVEAVIFNNFQDETEGASVGKPKRWGVGFATPDYQCGFSIDEDSGSMYQSESNSWVSKTTTATVSAGDVNFDPASGDIGLVVRENGAGNGSIGLMGIQTRCDDWIPLIYRLIYCQ